MELQFQKGVSRLQVALGENTVPLIMLQGEWLRRAGFDIGDEVLVTMETNRLTIDFEKRNGD